MTKGDNFMKRGKCKNNHCSFMSNSAWCDLNSEGNILKLHDNYPNPKCNCQKILTSTPHQYKLKGGSIKGKLQKKLRGTKFAWETFLKPALKMASPYIGKGVAAKTKNPKIGQATGNFLKSLSGGRFLNFTDMHGYGSRLRVM